MPYKISGTLGDAARIIVFKESDWSIESNSNESSGAYEVDELDSGAKLVIARKSDGELLGFGNVTGEYYLLDRGVFGGGTTGLSSNVIDYITISSAGNATNFGDLTVARYSLCACSNGGYDRGVFGAGYGAINTIDYITISTPGDATDFGDFSVSRWGSASCSNKTNNRGIFAGGYDSDELNIIDYITISSTGNATDFGDLSLELLVAAGTSNGTNNRGIIGGGRDVSATPMNNIDYITITSLGNGTDFGDLTVTRRYVEATSNQTSDRGVFGGGNNAGTYYNTIDYITISSASNATDFGDLTVKRHEGGAVSNGTNDRGVWGGGRDESSNSNNTIDYITISSTGDATDFGDLSTARRPAGVSNS